MARTIKEISESAALIVQDAGGEIVGRTRLQKIAYMLEAMSLGDGFSFSYKHYGPYSEELTSAVEVASLFRIVEEEEKPTTWGGFYSIFKLCRGVDDRSSLDRKRVVRLGVEANPVQLELAATAAFLACEGYEDPWAETAERKPDKTSGDALDKAKRLYSEFRKLDLSGKLPAI